ncbi:hypothetical protein M8494_19070 [Serratia ureilytica]
MVTLNAAGVPRTRLITAFSRDTADKIITCNTPSTITPVSSAACCGGARMSTRAAIVSIWNMPWRRRWSKLHGAENLWQTLIEQQRLHLELY